MALSHKKLPFFEFIILLAFMTSILALSIDCILPAFRIMTLNLKVIKQNNIQLTVSILFLGLGIGRLFFGPIADCYGRRIVVFIGFAIYITGCLFSLFSESLEVMLIGRILQGVGAAGPANITMSLVRDLYSGNEMARVMSYIMAVFIAVPILAPSIGLVIMEFFTWRYIFIFFIIFGTTITIWFYLRQAETLKPEYKKNISITYILESSKEIFKAKECTLYMCIIGLTSGAFLGYLGASQPIFEVLYDLGKKFPLYFGSLAMAVGLASYVNGRIVRRIGMRALSNWALVSIVIASEILICISIPYNGQPPLFVLFTFLAIILFNFGMLFGNLNSIAMEPVGHIAGMGAAVIGSVSTLISVPFAIVVGNMYNRTIYPLCIGFFISCLFSLILVKTIGDGELYQKN